MENLTNQEILVLAILAPFVGAFALRLIVGALKWIYEAAPFVIIMLGIVLFMWVYSDKFFPVNPNKEMGQDATNITAVKD